VICNAEKANATTTIDVSEARVEKNLVYFGGMEGVKANRI